MTHEDQLPFLKTVEQAMALKQTIVEDLQRVQLELSNKNAKGFDGRRMYSRDYHEWRQERLQTITILQRKIQHIKNWIHHQSNLSRLEKEPPPVNRVRSLELLFRRVKSYVEYNDQKGNGEWNPDEADQRWGHILDAVNEVEKSTEPAAPSSGSNGAAP